MDDVTTVLVADDESSVREVVADYLRRDGFTVVEAADGTAARRALVSGVDLAVLDVAMPGESGLELCRWLAGATPVILLTARAEETDRILGLELGADDYVTKPFSPREVVARVRTVLRRASVPVEPETSLVAGDLSMNATTREVRVRGEEVLLTAREFELLEFLARHPRHVFSREQVLDRVWGFTPASGDTATVTVHVRRLREKIELDPSAPRMLQTVHGVGYRFVP